MVNEKSISFNSLEREIYRFVCESGCEMVKQLLEQLDEKLERERDKSQYRHKGKRKTAVKTLMGTVEYSRTVYEITDGEPGKKYVYLLDDVLQRKNVGLYSEALAETIVVNCCEMPYRKAAAAVSGMTGQQVSHTAAWKVIQAVGERIEGQEQQAAMDAAACCGRGRHESKLLFEEMDGIWLKLQGKDRKEYGQSKEMKLSIAYDGAKKTGKKRYELQNKVACANFEESQYFMRRKEGIIADYYVADEIEMRILNGDGARWIQGSIESDETHYQLDTFHRNKAIARAVRQPAIRRKILRHLYNKQTDDALESIEILSNSVVDERERQALLGLYNYLKNNEAGLIGYHRRGLDLPAPPEGLVYRRLGAMESNVFSLVGFRMKRRRATWSIAGGNNLARLLCLKATRRLAEPLRNAMGTILPPEYTVETTRILRESQVDRRIGKGFDGFHHFAPPRQRTWLKDLLSQKPFSTMTLQ